MPPETRILGLGWHLPEETVSNEDLAGPLGLAADVIAARTGVAVRHRAPDGQGPSDLARRAADGALAATVRRRGSTTLPCTSNRPEWRARSRS